MKYLNARLFAFKIKTKFMPPKSMSANINQLYKHQFALRGGSRRINSDLHSAAHNRKSLKHLIKARSFFAA